MDNELERLIKGMSVEEAMRKAHEGFRIMRHGMTLQRSTDCEPPSGLYDTTRVGAKITHSNSDGVPEPPYILLAADPVDYRRSIASNDRTRADRESGVVDPPKVLTK